MSGSVGLFDLSRGSGIIAKQMATARDLLSYVLGEARETLDRSPEQVGAAVGMAGRTIRRLEDAQYHAQPRQTTLTTLASFYGLDAQFITELANWEGSEESLLRWMRGQVGSRAQEVEGGSDEARQLALLLSRGAGRGNGANEASEVAVSGNLGVAKSHLWSLVSHRSGGGALLAGLDEDADDLGDLVDSFVRLDRRRRRLVLSLVDELRRAREAERSGS